MKLASLLHPDCVLTSSPASGIEDAIQSIFKQLYREFKFELNHDQVLAEIHRRDSLGGTILPCGLAIPHARIEGLNDLVVGVAIPKRPFFVEGVEVKMVCLLLSSLSSSTIYLNTLAAIAKVNENKPFLEKLLAARSGSEFIALLEKADVSIKKELTVADIMRTGIPTVSIDDNLKTVGDRLAKTGYTMLPVLDAQGKLLGEVTSHDFIARALPNYAILMENLAFTSSLEPFDEFLKTEGTLSVREIMEKPTAALKPSTSVVEAAHEMIQHRKRCLCVVDNGTFVGVVGHPDIISKVMRG